MDFASSPSERKTDVLDCAPPAPIRELQDLTRYRKTQIQERVREVNRLHKVLEDGG